MAKKSTLNPGIILVISFVVLFAVNSLVVYLSSLWFSNHVVLGTFTITPVWALIHAMGTLSLINTFAIPFLNQYEADRGKKLSSTEWMLAYFIVNFAGIWLITRFADQLGFGISSWVVAVVLAAVLDIFQGMAMMSLERKRTRSYS